MEGLRRPGCEYSRLRSRDLPPSSSLHPISGPPPARFSNPPLFPATNVARARAALGVEAAGMAASLVTRCMQLVGRGRGGGFTVMHAFLSSGFRQVVHAPHLLAVGVRRAFFLCGP